MKKVLIIAHSFPPRRGAGIQRTLKFVKYLSQYGWIPIVLTADKQSASACDQSLLDDLPEKSWIIRTRGIDLRRRGEKKQDILRYAEENNKNNDYRRNSHWQDIFMKFLKFLLRPLRWVLSIPDFQMGWNPFTFLAALKIIYKEKIDLIYISGNPFSSFLLGPFLKLITKRPYILDFRDEWSEFWIKPEGIGGKISKKRRKMEELMEKFVVKYADIVISVTNSIIGNFRRRYNKYNPDKFTCITNGFDYMDFSENLYDGRLSGEKLTFSYVGTLSETTDMEPFLKALERVIIENTRLEEEIEVRFVGRISSEMKPIFSKYQFTFLESTGYILHNKSIECLCNTDILLLFLRNFEGSGRILTGKIFEYIAAGKLIFAIAPEGEVKELIKKHNRGFCIHPDDIDGIKEKIIFLMDYYKKNRSLEGLYSKEILWQYERKNLTKELANVFNAVSRNKELC